MLLGILLGAWMTFVGIAVWAYVVQRRGLSKAQRILRGITLAPPMDPPGLIPGANVIQTVWERRSRFLS